MHQLQEVPPMSVSSHPLRITERDVIKEQSLDEWFNSFKVWLSQVSQ